MCKFLKHCGEGHHTKNRKHTFLLLEGCGLQETPVLFGITTRVSELPLAIVFGK